MNKLKFWIDNARSVALPQSLLPCITAIVLSIGYDGFFWPLAIPVVLGIAAAHLGMNLADDYFDYMKGLPSGELRSTLAAGGSVRARMEKCHYILSGQANAKDLRNTFVSFLAFAGLMGLIVVVVQYLRCGLVSALFICFYALLALALGIQYSAAPLRLGYHGFGEVVIGVMFGPLNMMGVCAAMTGSAFRPDMFLLSLGVGCMVTNIVYVHSVMESEADKQLGKFTFAHLLGSKKSQTAAIGFFAILPFICLLINIILYDWSPWFLLTLATLPMSLYLVKSTWAFINDLPRNDRPRWWMGPMGDWDNYVKAGIDWFLFRWLMARNIDTFFCLIVIVVYIIGLFA